MDYFEALVRTLLEAEGYWTRQSFKVNLTREEKRVVANPSIPRPEVDFFWGASQVKSKIAAFAESAYENDPVVIAAKILLRDV